MAPANVPERLLRQIWQYRLFNSAPLFTSDGKSVVVRSPGSPNTDAGPDFLEAIVRIGGVLYRGDIEIHSRPGSWRAHGHSTDPHYNSVILHVVLHRGTRTPPPCTASGRIVPVLVLSSFVDHRLLRKRGSDSKIPRAAPVHCYQTRRSVRRLEEMMRELGRRRIEARVRLLGERLDQLAEERDGASREGAGSPTTSDAWEQLLYESLFEGMGYSKNRLPFLALARAVPLRPLVQPGPGDSRRIQAIMFGSAGLLPALYTLREPENRAFVRSLLREWRRIRPVTGVQPLHERDWYFHRLRPANFPTARLAVFCSLLPHLFADHPMDRIVRILKDPARSQREKISSLVGMFGIAPVGFWARHIHFNGIKRTRGIALGRERAHALIVNTIIPISLLHARLSSDGELRRESHALLGALPAAEENSVTRFMKRGMRARPSALRAPLAQQGLIHLYKSFCARRNCGRCLAARRRAIPPFAPRGTVN